MKVLCWFRNSYGDTDTQIINSVSHLSLETELLEHLRHKNNLKGDFGIKATTFENMLQKTELLKYLPESNTPTYG